MNGDGVWREAAPRDRGTRIFADGDELWRRACEYFAWCDDAPWRRCELAVSRVGNSIEEVPVGRPYTQEGLALFLGVSGSYFRQAEAELAAKDEQHRITESERGVLDAIRRIRTAIRCQQIEGAAVGIFNHSLVARLNGLTDRQDITSAGGRLVNITVRDEATAERLRELEELL
ncbi:terminase small subunit [uncultured Alistipes sp.]|uniref:terminase small subunit n=1 Tax=uncultured Alistipes sp. TaxID=538949 RepID=UPI00261D646A|nr:terminase small subunit [uncultured Alistipes sp.]